MPFHTRSLVRLREGHFASLLAGGYVGATACVGGIARFRSIGVLAAESSEVALATATSQQAQLDFAFELSAASHTKVACESAAALFLAPDHCSVTAVKPEEAKHGSKHYTFGGARLR